jgi:hypothetical protein
LVGWLVGWLVGLLVGWLVTHKKLQIGCFILSLNIRGDGGINLLQPGLEPATIWLIMWPPLHALRLKAEAL